jgi:hypothetical protein
MIFIDEPHVPRKCVAYARSSGAPCKQYALANSKCHYHGGKTPVKHGRRTKKAIAEKRAVLYFLKESKGVLNEIL